MFGSGSFPAHFSFLNSLVVAGWALSSYCVGLVLQVAPLLGWALGSVRFSGSAWALLAPTDLEQDSFLIISFLGRRFSSTGPPGEVLTFLL